jgi:hypothetical protein
VTVYVFGVTFVPTSIDSAAVLELDPDVEDGVKAGLVPVGSPPLTLRLTVPEKPPDRVTVIVYDELSSVVPPVSPYRLGGEAEIAKPAAFPTTVECMPAPQALLDGLLLGSPE